MKSCTLESLPSNSTLMVAYISYFSLQLKLLNMLWKFCFCHRFEVSISQMKKNYLLHNTIPSLLPHNDSQNSDVANPTSSSQGGFSRSSSGDSISDQVSWSALSEINQPPIGFQQHFCGQRTFLDSTAKSYWPWKKKKSTASRQLGPKCVALFCFTPIVFCIMPEQRKVAAGLWQSTNLAMHFGHLNLICRKWQRKHQAFQVKGKY